MSQVKTTTYTVLCDVCGKTVDGTPPFVPPIISDWASFQPSNIDGGRQDACSRVCYMELAAADYAFQTQRESEPVA